MKNFRAARVIAFDSNNEPVRIPLEDWKINIDSKSGLIEFRSSKAKVSYSIRKDALYMGIADQREETAVGKTIGRIALTGIASSFLSRGKGVGGALMDLSLRGADKRSVITAIVILRDTTSVIFDVEPEEYEQLKHIVPVRAQSEHGAGEASTLVDLADRMGRDGLRVLPELKKEIEQLQVQQKVAAESSETGASFSERDASRQLTESIASELERKLSLMKAVDYQLRSGLPPALPEGTKESEGQPNATGFLGIFIRVGLGLVAVVFALGIYVSFFEDGKPHVVTTPNPKSSLAVPGSDSASTKPVAQAVTPEPTKADIEVAEVKGITPQLAPTTLQSAATVAPSFNCAKAENSVEKLICVDEKLAILDIRMATVYGKVIDSIVDKGTLREQQGKWRVERRDSCQSAECVASAYEDRITELERSPLGK